MRPYTFCPELNERSGHPTSRTRDSTEPTPAITDETLQVDIRHFKDAPEDIRADTDVDTADQQTRSHGTHHRNSLSAYHTISAPFSAKTVSLSYKEATATPKPYTQHDAFPPEVSAACRYRNTQLAADFGDGLSDQSPKPMTSHISPRCEKSRENY